MSQVIDPKIEIENRIVCCISLPKDQLIREIICVASNCYWDFANDIQPTTDWSWASWIMKNGIINSIDIFCEAAFLVAQKYDCLNDVDIKSMLRKKIIENENKIPIYEAESL